MDCLIRLGCRADERATFREILAEVAEHGGSTMFEAATLANMICRQRTHVTELLGQRKGQSLKPGGLAVLGTVIAGSKDAADAALFGSWPSRTRQELRPVFLPLGKDASERYRLIMDEASQVDDLDI